MWDIRCWCQDDICNWQLQTVADVILTASDVIFTSVADVRTTSYYWRSTAVKYWRLAAVRYLCLSDVIYWRSTDITYWYWANVIGDIGMISVGNVGQMSSSNVGRCRNSTLCRNRLATYWGDIIGWHRPDVRKDVGPMSSRSTALYCIDIRSLALYRTCLRHHLTMWPDIFWHQCDIIGWHRPDIRKGVGPMSTRSPELYRIYIRNLAYYRTCHRRHSIDYVLCGF